jgi:hypothetical protein
MLTTALKRIRSLGEGRRPRSVSKDVPPSVFSSDAEPIRVTSQFIVDDVDLIVQTISQHDIVYGSPWDDFRIAEAKPFRISNKA